MGKPLGVLHSPCLITVAKESGQGADTICGQNVLKMFARFDARSWANGIWLVPQAALEQLWQATAYSTAVSGASTATTAMPLVLPQGVGLNTSKFPLMLGCPIVPVEHVNKLGDAGDIILADFTQYVLADRGGPQMAVSMHVRFLYDEQTFRVTFRTAGAPWWASAVTPWNGGDTTSPFVTLAARA